MLWKLLFAHALSTFLIPNERVSGDLDIKAAYIVFRESKKKKTKKTVDTVR